MNIAVKICGLSDEKNLHEAVSAGADFIGFVYYPRSPRHVTLTKAALLKSTLPSHIKSVVVTVNPEDELIKNIIGIVNPDFLQLHGSESPDRVRQMRSRFAGLGIIKAIPVSCRADLDSAIPYQGIVDYLLFDAKPTDKTMMHGGNGIVFDWSLLSGFSSSSNWFLSGGLNCENISQAIKTTGAKMVDVSSGVETGAGVKDKELINAFVKTVKNITQ